MSRLRLTIKGPAESGGLIAINGSTPMDNIDPRSLYPDYDVLAKRTSLSWNDATRRVIDARLAVPREPRFFSGEQWATLVAVCRRILPQPADRPEVPIAALLDNLLRTDDTQGFRVDPLPYDGPAWKQGLVALEAEARAAYHAAFPALSERVQDALLKEAQAGRLHHPAWAPMTAALFFKHRILTDIPALYYAHPTSWSEIGFGGPAGPRGYVRMGLNRRDPWEAREVGATSQAPARALTRHAR